MMGRVVPNWKATCSTRKLERYDFESGETNHEDSSSRSASYGIVCLRRDDPCSSADRYGFGLYHFVPFYAQNTKLPPGSYKVTQADFDSNALLIQSADGKYSAFIDFTPTRAEQPHRQADVTFHKYGDVDYLNRLWVDGQRYGMKLEPTKAEKKAATAAKPVEHSVPGKKH